MIGYDEYTFPFLKRINSEFIKIKITSANFILLAVSRDVVFNLN